MKTTRVYSYPNLALLVIAWALGRAPGLAQDLPFTSASTGADGPLHLKSAPPASYGASLAYDSTAQGLVLYGGYSGSAYLTDLAQWDGTNWTQLSPAGIPSSRYYAGMAFDAARQQLIVFAGNPAGPWDSSTYSWNGSNWMTLNPQTSPSPRYDHAMVYDAARQSILVFGGYYSGSINETWSWNGTNWLHLNPVNAPSARYGGAAAYDEAHQRIVLFGGYGPNNTPVNDTWTWDGTNWRSNSPSVSPPPLGDARLAFHAASQLMVLFGGSTGTQWPSNTWAWDGTNWAQLAPLTSPPGRDSHVLAYDPGHQRIVLFGGKGSGGALGDAWSWDGTNWSQDSGSPYVFDMSARSSGIWNYTSINVDSNVTVTFKKNTARTPVQWLASDFVNINGTLNLNGADGGTTTPLPGNEAPGGPGGFAGGLGGIRFDQSGSYAGTPGQGPGGGLPGVSSGQGGNPGTYSTTYGNAYIQPLIGGSGGGGAASGPTQNGFNGGGGGGAILISSSRDITVNGAILARGGNASGNSGPNGGGAGSGGAIRLQADRVSGSGSLDASPGYSYYAPGTGYADPGRIRIEAYYRSLAGSTTPISVNSAPITNQNFTAQGALVIASVAGQNFAQPPSGNTLTPDVVFTSAGPINVTATSTNIPDGTPVVLRVTSSGQVIQSTNTLASGAANFSVTVPAGVGTIQASASSTINN